ncbi:MAG: DUF2442 domain-containing protein [Chloroflexi bacterium]|nr:DUF2442 domain-containing protein [Chloroflexota bacterium]
MPVVMPTAVEPRRGCRIWLSYEDGAHGEVDLSDLSGRGVFRAWADRAFFEAVRIEPHGGIAWGADIELCPDALYLQLTGKTPDQIMPGILRPVDDA